MRSLGGFVLVGLALTACLSSADLTGGTKGNATAAAACTADLMTDIGNCGACGHVCPNNANAYGTCAAGKCAIGCNTGFADCDGNAANGCEVVLASDANHCGTCSHSCNGAQCSAGSCDGVVLTTLESEITSFIVDGTDLFLGLQDESNSSTGSIIRLDSNGANRVDLVAGLTQGPRSLAVDSNDVYFTRPSTAAANLPQNGGIYRSSRAESTTVETISATEAPAYAEVLQVTSGYVYWVTPQTGYESGTTFTQVPGKVRRASTTAPFGPADVIALTNQSVQSYIVDGADVYLSLSGPLTAPADPAIKPGVYRCATTGCGTSPELLPAPTESNYPYLATTTSTLFVGNNGFIGQMQKPGTNYSLFATTRGELIQFVSDDKDIYWLDGQSLFSCPVTGCMASPLEVDMHANATALALTADAVYVAVTAGTNGVLVKVVR